MEPPRNAGWISHTSALSLLQLAVEPPRNAGWISVNDVTSKLIRAVEPPRNAGWISYTLLRLLPCSGCGTPAKRGVDQQNSALFVLLLFAVEPPRNAGWISPDSFIFLDPSRCGTPAKRGVDQPWLIALHQIVLLWNPRETRGGSACCNLFSYFFLAVEPPRNAGWISRRGAGLFFRSAVEPPRNAGWISPVKSLCTSSSSCGTPAKRGVDQLGYKRSSTLHKAVEPPRNAGWISSKVNEYALLVLLWNPRETRGGSAETTIL